MANHPLETYEAWAQELTGLDLEAVLDYEFPWEMLSLARKRGIELFRHPTELLKDKRGLKEALPSHLHAKDPTFALRYALLEKIQREGRHDILEKALADNIPLQTEENRGRDADVTKMIMAKTLSLQALRSELDRRRQCILFSLDEASIVRIASIEKILWS